MRQTTRASAPARCTARTASPWRAARRAAALSGLGLVGATATATTAAAQGSTPPPTIDACFVPASGTIYRINTPASPAPGAPSGCFSPAHVRFTWNQQGPKGDPGPGLSGFSEVTSGGSPPATPNGVRSMTATCPAGTMAVGGYYSVFAAGGNYAWGIQPVSSGVLSTSLNPSDPPNAFFVLTADPPGYAGVPFLRVVVKCATVR